MNRRNNRKGALMRTPDVTCECGHRVTAHEHSHVAYGFLRSWCEFCDCAMFEPRDRSIPSQPTQFAGTHARLPIHKMTARKNEDAS